MNTNKKTPQNNVIMKLNNILISIAFFLMVGCSAGSGSSFAENDLIGTWSRPINSGMTITTTNPDGSKETIDPGPTSDEIMIFNADMTFTMKETPRSSNPDFYSQNGTWRMAEDKSSVDIFIEGVKSNFPITNIENGVMSSISMEGNVIRFGKIQ